MNAKELRSDVSEYYNLPASTLPTIEIEGHLSDIRSFRVFLSSLDIVTKNTRIERNERYLEGCVEAQSINHDASVIFKNSISDSFQCPMDWHLYILREIHELMWIYKGLLVHVPKGVEIKLKEIVSGRDFAALDKNTLSRNSQYELRVASYFFQSGYRVDVSTETDIIAKSKKDTYIIECKRVASTKSLIKRIFEAGKQIKNRFPKGSGGKVHGVICTDVTKVAFPHNGLTYGMTNEHSRDVIQGELIRIRQEIESSDIFNQSDRILLCWLQIHIATAIQLPFVPATRFSSADIVNDNLDRRQRKAIKRLYEAMSVGSLHDVREIPAQKLKRRQSLSVPAGTEFYFNEEIFTGYFACEDLSHYEDVHSVGSMKMNEKEYDFSIGELRMLDVEEVLKGKVEEVDDFTDRCICMILELYMSRYPFKGHE